jgi:lysophospholipase L1-like esterase
MRKLITSIAPCIALSFSLLTATAAFSQDAPAPGAKYVALGSSFAAGPGVATQLGTCGRSDHNYSHLVAAELGLTLTDVSCGGATIPNIVNSTQRDAAPQIDAVSRDTALVTVTIGGNDIRFTPSTCACAGKAPADNCTANLDQAAISASVKQLPARLETMLDARCLPDGVYTHAPRRVSKSMGRSLQLLLHPVAGLPPLIQQSDGSSEIR